MEPSLGKGPDWIRDTDLWKTYEMDWLGGGANASPRTIGNLIGLFAAIPSPSQVRSHVLSAHSRLFSFRSCRSQLHAQAPRLSLGTARPRQLQCLRAGQRLSRTELGTEYVGTRLSSGPDEDAAGLFHSGTAVGERRAPAGSRPFLP